MNALDFQSMIAEAIETSDYSDDVRAVSTFEDSGVLTYDKGLVIKLDDGSEFQVTIVQSAYGENDDEDDDEEG